MPPVRLTTITSVTPGAFVKASSVLVFSGIGFAAAHAFIGGDDDACESQSMMRPARLSGEKPPNTTECTAPMRAQASMA